MEITTTATKKGRINVNADGEYRFTVPAFIWAESALYEGCEADEDDLAALREQATAFEAEEAAVRLLACRAHSERELTLKLRRKYPADVAAETAAAMRKGLSGRRGVRRGAGGGAFAREALCPRQDRFGADGAGRGQRNCRKCGFGS